MNIGKYKNMRNQPKDPNLNSVEVTNMKGSKLSSLQCRKSYLTDASLPRVFGECSTKLQKLLQVIDQIESFHKENLCSGRLEMKHFEIVKEGTEEKIRLSPSAFEPFVHDEALEEEQVIDRSITSIRFDRYLQVRKIDDLESIGYLTTYLLQGQLPWYKHTDGKDKLSVKKAARMKENYNWKMISKDLPVEVSLFLKYINDLKEGDEINYSMMKSLLEKHGSDFDFNGQSRLESVEDSRESYSESDDSDEDSFDPMAAVIIERKTRAYHNKELSKNYKTSNLSYMKEKSDLKETVNLYLRGAKKLSDLLNQI